MSDDWCDACGEQMVELRSVWADDGRQLMLCDDCAEIAELMAAPRYDEPEEDEA